MRKMLMYLVFLISCRGEFIVDNLNEEPQNPQKRSELVFLLGFFVDVIFTLLVELIPLAIPESPEENQEEHVPIEIDDRRNFSRAGEVDGRRNLSKEGGVKVSRRSPSSYRSSGRSSSKGRGRGGRGGKGGRGGRR